MRTTSILMLVLVAFWLIMALVDVWFDVVSWETLIKVSVSIVILAGLLGVLRALKFDVSNKDDEEHDAQRRDGQ